MPDWLQRLIADEVRDVVRALLRKHGVDVAEADRAAHDAARVAAETACVDVPADLPKMD